MEGTQKSANLIARLTFWVEIIGFFVTSNYNEMFSGFFVSYFLSTFISWNIYEPLTLNPSLRNFKISCKYE